MILQAPLQILAPLLRSIGRLALPESMSRQKGTTAVPGLRHSVEVRRDEWGTPHLSARNEHDLFLAQGYLHAADRLWSLEVARRLFQGRLAETFGPMPLGMEGLVPVLRGYTLVELDHLMRAFQLTTATARAWEVASSTAREVLEAYVTGVNRFLEQGCTVLPPEFRLLGLEPEPWTTLEPLLLQKGIAFQLAISWRNDFAWQVVADECHEKGLDPTPLLPRLDEEEPSITNFEGWKPGRRSQDLLKVYKSFRGFGGFAEPVAGSNNWVVAGSRTASGKPMLANDPHLLLQVPGFFQETVLECPTLSLAGVSCPGTPGISLGTNGHIAWGITATLADEADLYAELVNPDNPNEYQGPDGSWVPFEEASSDIHVKGMLPRRIRLRSTVRGPVISDAGGFFGQHERVISFRWPSHDATQETDAWLQMTRARNWEEFRAALDLITAPVSNFVYADHAGNIGFQVGGKVPVRKTTPPAGILDAANPDHAWLGYIHQDGLPHVLNPDEGFLVTANNRSVYPGEYPYYISRHYEPPYRARRIVELLRDRPTLTVQDMEDIQNDLKDLYALEYKEEFLRPVLRHLQKDESLSLTERRAAGMLADWDGHATAESVGAALFYVTNNQVMHLLFGEVLSEAVFMLYLDTMNTPALAVLRVLREKPEGFMRGRSVEELLLRAFRHAVRFLGQHCGEEVGGWTWGRLHRAELRHVFGQDWRARPFFGVGGDPVGGSNMTVAAAFYLYNQPFLNIVGPAYRFVLDLGELPNSRSILPPGSSGHPFSRHYDDQYPLWRDGRYKAFPLPAGQRPLPELLLLVP
jgi:penicillin G amidase